MNKNEFIFNSMDEEASSDSLSAAIRSASLNSFGNNSPQFSASPCHDNDSVSDNSKKIRKKRNNYQKIDDDTRIKLLEAVQKGDTLKAAAKRFNINYSSAKSILHTFRKEGRILKKSAQERIARKRGKASSELEMSPIYAYQSSQEVKNQSDNLANQFYRSSEAKLKNESPANYGLTDQERSGLNGMTLNSVGNFLKIDSQSPVKDQNPIPKYSNSMIAFKLEPQGLKRLSSNNNSRSMQAGNLKLNVNIHSKIPEIKLRSLTDNSQQLANSSSSKDRENNFDLFCMNFMNSNLSPQNKPKVKEQDYYPRTFQRKFENFPSKSTEIKDACVPDEQNYDVSCFLNSSPAYAFQTRPSEAEEFETSEGFSSFDNFREKGDPLDLFCSGTKGSPHLNTFGIKLEQGTKGYMETASLRSY